MLKNYKKIAIDLYGLGFSDEKVERALIYTDDLRIEAIIDKFLLPYVSQDYEVIEWNHKFVRVGTHQEEAL